MEAVKVEPPSPDSPSPAQPVTLSGVKFKNDSYALVVDKDKFVVTDELVATYTDNSVKPLTPTQRTNVAWEIDNSDKLLINQDENTIRGENETSEKRSIVATLSDKSAQATIEIIDDIKTMMVTADKLRLSVGGAPTEVKSYAYTYTGRTSESTNLAEEWDVSSNAKLDENTMELVANSPGTVRLAARYRAKDGTMMTSDPVYIHAKQVTPGPDSAVQILPTVAPVQMAGDDQQIVSVLTDSQGEMLSEPQLATWSSSDPDLATVNDGLVEFKSGRSGTVNISAKFGDKTDTRGFTVDSSPLNKVSMILPKAQVIAGHSVDFVTLANFANGRSSDVSKRANYTVTPEGAVTVRDNRITSTTGTTGTVDITTSYRGVTGETVSLEINQPYLDTLSIVTSTTGGTVSNEGTFVDLRTGSTEGVKTNALANDGVIYDVSERVIWRMDNPNVLLVEQNKIRALKEGIVTLTASYEGLTDHIVVRVVPAEIDSIHFFNHATKTPTDGLSLNGQEALKLSLVGLQSNSDVHLPIDLSSVDLKWVPEDNTNSEVLASKTEDGNVLLTYGKSGSGQLIASYKGYTTSMPIVLRTESIIQHLTVAPKEHDSRFYVGQTLPFSASLTYGDNTTSPLSSQRVVWTVDNHESAKISPQGELTTLAPGEVTLIGTFWDNDNNSHSAAYKFNIEQAVNIESFRVGTSKNTRELVEGETISLTPSIEYADGRVEQLDMDNVTLSDPENLLGKIAGSTLYYASRPARGEVTFSYGQMSTSLLINIYDQPNGELVIDCDDANIYNRRSTLCALKLRSDERERLVYPELSSRDNNVLFNKQQDSGYFYPVANRRARSGDTALITACSLGKECVDRELEIQTVEIQNQKKDNPLVFDQRKIFVPLNRPTTLPTSLFKVGGNKLKTTNAYVEYGEENYRFFSDTPDVGTVEGAVFYPKSVGSAIVTGTIQLSGNSDDVASGRYFVEVFDSKYYPASKPTYFYDEERSWPLNNLVIETNDLPTAQQRPSEDTAGEPSWHPYRGIFTDATSRFHFESLDPDFAIRTDSKNQRHLDFNGSHLPSSVTLKVSPPMETTDRIVIYFANKNEGLVECDSNPLSKCILTGKVKTVFPEGVYDPNPTIKGEYAFIFDDYLHQMFNEQMHSQDAISSEDHYGITRYELSGVDDSVTNISKMNRSVISMEKNDENEIILRPRYSLRAGNEICTILNSKAFKEKTNWEVSRALPLSLAVTHDKVGQQMLGNIWTTGQGVLAQTGSSNGAMNLGYGHSAGVKKMPGKVARRLRPGKLAPGVAIASCFSPE